jgi:peptidoglycan/LPS O-acetylase OafA/YrhL
MITQFQGSRSDRSSKAATRVPSLDGLRAISILMVLAAHQASYSSGKLISVVMTAGPLGVRFFFVISGFLITTLLLRERHMTGAISLQNFYVRRCLRILPAFYMFVLAIVVLQRMQWITLPPDNLWYVLTYTMNYAQSGVYWTGHLWSLSVEEQFYLIWPVMMRLFSVKANTMTAVAFMTIAPVLRFLSVIIDPSRHAFWRVLFPSEAFQLIADAIACGCLLAIVLPQLENRPWFTRLLASRIALLAFPTIVLLNALGIAPSWFPARLYALTAVTIVNIGITFYVARAILLPTDTVGKLLNSRLLISIGVLSYSLYLWQQIFINPYSHSVFQKFPLNLVLVFAAATLSYYGLERPLLGIRRKFRAVKKADSPSFEQDQRLFTAASV